MKTEGGAGRASWMRFDAFASAIAAIAIGGGTVCLSAWLARHGLRPIAVGLLVVAAGLIVVLFVELRRARVIASITVDDAGIVCEGVRTAWDRVAARSSRSGIELQVGDRRVRLSLQSAGTTRFLELAGAIRARIIPERWNVVEHGARPRPKSRRPSVTDATADTATYRAPSTPAQHALPTWYMRRTWPALALGALLALPIGIALLASSGGPPRRPARCREHVDDVERRGPAELAAFLGGVTMLLVAAGSGMAASFRYAADRGLRAARRTLGDDARRDAHGAIVSADGRQHLWHDGLDEHPIAPALLWLSERDAHGHVIRMQPFAAVSHSAVRAHTRLVARLSSPATSKLLRGEAHELAVVVIDLRDDGVVLHRFDSRRLCVGSTWHASRDDAGQQLVHEVGAHDPSFQECPLEGGPIAFFAYA